MKTIEEYIREHESRFLEEWFSLLRIPSVSSDPARKAEMAACARVSKRVMAAVRQIRWCMRKSACRQKLPQCWSTAITM